MRYFRWLWLAALPGCPCGFAQFWSVGGAAGFGFYHDATITNPSGSANAGFGPRVAASAVLGEDVSEHFGAELRYTFRDGDSELKFHGSQANMDAEAHAVHFDFLGYLTGRHARFRPFAALGAGIKEYHATGREDPFQPLSDFALLTHGHEAEGLLSAGGGIKVPLGDRWVARFDFRDYATPFPQHLIAPAPGAKLHGWLHDFVEMVGVEWRFGRR